MRGGTVFLICAAGLGWFMVAGQTPAPSTLPVTPSYKPAALYEPGRFPKAFPTVASPIPAPQAQKPTASPPNAITKPTVDQPDKTTRTVEKVLTAAAIAALIIEASRSAYHAGGRPCACPNDRMRNGRSCGGRSAYSRPGGAAPLCYSQDVSAAMIEQYRSKMASR